MKKKLIDTGVKNLNEFGYPHCNRENILTDAIYKQFFAEMLKDNKGHSSDIDIAIDELLIECQS